MNTVKKQSHRMISEHTDLRHRFELEVHQCKLDA